ncbi:MAG TPA: tetratricopeptide repeat protein, partial [Nitrospinota bacterium]|nr:tetratricopeptide repeat protein [Nitrospinota bacterium]
MTNGPARRVILILLIAGWLPGQSARAEKTENADPALKALYHWRRGYVYHLLRQFPMAIAEYRKSIAAKPTAEGHTFLGWSLSMLERYREAIAECKKAIPLDPDFGNPYNDIGVYLVALDRVDEAIPYLKKAIRSKRYCCYQFAHHNMGRMWVMKGKYEEA